MKQCYVVRDPDEGVFAAAIADVVRMPVDSTRREYFVVTRINVMERYWGRGYGTQVLEQVLANADAEGVDLLFEPSATGGLSQEELVKWYERHGFEWGAWHMRRRPRPRKGC